MEIRFSAEQWLPRHPDNQRTLIGVSIRALPHQTTPSPSLIKTSNRIIIPEMERWNGGRWEKRHMKGWICSRGRQGLRQRQKNRGSDWQMTGKDCWKGHQELRCERYKRGEREKCRRVDHYRTMGEGWTEDVGGSREEGRDKGRGANCSDLKGRAMGVEEDTEENDQ